MSISCDPLWKNAPKWPYPVNYSKENEVISDVLIIGGGVAGCHAAISAAKKGAKVAIVDKAAIIRSGSGGAGVDHWGQAYKNPCSKTTPEEAMRTFGKPAEGDAYRLGHVRYITARESWDALLDMERWGMKIRDVDNEFVGAPFRDEKSKLLFAYDYDNYDTIRVQGAKVKVFLSNEVKRQGVKLYEHVMATSLLKERGDSGKRVIGATGFNVRTGEFYIFRAKATIFSTAQPLRLWIFNTELTGSATEHDDPNLAGDGDAMGWLAGAELTMMERSQQSAGPFRYPAYGTGNAHNTWFACNIVDARGKPVPWVDSTGKIMKTVEERYHAGGQGPGGATLIPDLAERIMKGEYILPFYADLPGMPEQERRAIFGLMVAHEGKTYIPIYHNYTQAGFDPDKDMLQANVLPPQLAGQFSPWWSPGQVSVNPSSSKATPSPGSLFGAPQWRVTAFSAGGGLMVDWDLRTNLEGLYAAGCQTASGGGHPGAAANGRYAGRKAADYAKTAKEPVIDPRQVEDEKARVYAPVGREGDIGWKELQAGICRIMQDYCGEYKSEEILKTGLWWLNSIRENEVERTYIRNPHELWRFHECIVRLTVGEIIMHASLARKASSRFMDLKRIDYPEMDPPEWNKIITVRLENGQVKVGELPSNYWLQPPYAPKYEENYRLHSGL